ncbi:MAG: hypothetical protein RJB47_445 [Pseudomonadota bacterium]
MPIVAAASLTAQLRSALRPRKPMPWKNPETEYPSCRLNSNLQRIQSEIVDT